MLIRPATPHDFPHILALNATWEHLTSTLDDAGLASLHAQAVYHRVFAVDDAVAGFLLALGPGAAYASQNYRWFEAHSSHFWYIDRIVVDARHQGQRIGSALYDDLRAAAKRGGVSRLTCEVDIEPHNAASDAFHTRRGFVELATQTLVPSGKRVSLRELALP